MELTAIALRGTRAASSLKVSALHTSRQIDENQELYRYMLVPTFPITSVEVKVLNSGWCLRVQLLSFYQAATIAVHFPTLTSMAKVLKLIRPFLIALCDVICRKDITSLHSSKPHPESTWRYQKAVEWPGQMCSRKKDVLAFIVEVQPSILLCLASFANTKFTQAAIRKMQLKNEKDYQAQEAGL